MKQKRSRFTDTENKLVFTSSKRKGGEGQYRDRRVKKKMKKENKNK